MGGKTTDVLGSALLVLAVTEDAAQQSPRLSGPGDFGVRYRHAVKRDAALACIGEGLVSDAKSDRVLVPIA